MKLIDKDALVAEIERRRDLHYKYYIKNGAGSIAECKYDEDREILSLIDTLEVKEVDLEKEINEKIDDEWCDEWSGDVGNWIRYRRGTRSMEVEDVEEIARHFFELGMAVSNKAQKGEEV